MQQVRQREVDIQWDRALRTPVKVVMGGRTIRLTGKQIVGLHAHAQRANSGQVAFANDDGMRVVLSLHALEILKQQLEQKFLVADAADAAHAGAYATRYGAPPSSTASNHSAAELAARLDDGSAPVASAVTFLDAQKVREAARSGELRRGPRGKLPAALPSLTEIEERYPDWLVRRSLSVADAASGAHVSSILAVSHRWEHGRGAVVGRSMGGAPPPDPQGVQLAAIAEVLEQAEVELLYYDYSCTRTPEEEAALAAVRAGRGCRGRRRRRPPPRRRRRRARGGRRRGGRRR